MSLIILSSLSQLDQVRIVGEMWFLLLALVLVVEGAPGGSSFGGMFGASLAEGGGKYAFDFGAENYDPVEKSHVDYDYDYRSDDNDDGDRGRQYFDKSHVDYGDYDYEHRSDDYYQDENVHGGEDYEFDTFHRNNGHHF